jgi:hypothetical protein
VQSDNQSDSLEIGAWLICGGSAIFAVYLLIAGRVGVDVQSLGAPLLIVGFPIAAYIVYGRWRPEPIIHNICGVLAVITLSAATAGIISLAGLRMGAPLIDANLAAFDASLLLDTRSIVFAVANATTFANLLGLAYVSSFPILFASVVFLGWKRYMRPLWQLAFVFAFTAVGCASLSVFFPAVGAFAHFAYPAEVLNGLPSGAGVYHLPKFEYYRHAVSPAISMSSLQGVVTFPSFHCCLALMTAFAYAEHRWLLLISLLWNALVIVSTIPIGGHYMVDLPIGAAIWVTAYLLARALWPSRAETTLRVARSNITSG